MNSWPDPAVPVRFILARPNDAKNLLDAALALRVFGFRDLRVVDPSPEVGLSVADVAERSGVNIILCDSLSTATADCSLVAGLTRRRGQRRKPGIFSLEEFAARFVGRPFATSGDPTVPVRLPALVFGNETSGLSDEELGECHLSVEIPTNPDCPSLNLSHAVALVAFVVRRHSEARREARRPVPLDRREVDRLTELVLGEIRRLGFLTQEGPQGMPVFLRDLFARARMSPDEAERVGELFGWLR